MPRVLPTVRGMRRIAPTAVLALIIAVAGSGAALMPGGDRAARAGRNSGTTYAALAASAVSALEHSYYTGAGTWNMCVPAICRSKNLDWGADSLTYALYMHWYLTADKQVKPIMAALALTAHQYGPSSTSMSDVPMWDTIADVREYQVTGDPAALAKAEAAFSYVDSTAAAHFAAGACPKIDYQSPGGGANNLKTLETDSNYVKAALLLYQVTGKHAYLTKAENKYAAVRSYFLSPSVPLYTVYVFDDRSHCAQLPGRFYASVNGNMIWSGAELTGLTGNPGYLAQAVATAKAVRHYLSDAAGVYADLQAENDVAEPLIEAMYLLATADHQGFARDWLLRCASAAAADETPLGSYGRFFDGPPPRTNVTAWQTNGGFALMIAAAKLDPTGVPADPSYWHNAVWVSDNKSLPAGGGTVQIGFSGRAIAIIGTMGEHCCEAGHARVYIDGTITFDRTGIWQNKSSSGRTISGTVLFAWRWPAADSHVINIGAAPFNPKEGGPFFHMTGYYLVP
jgi:hypothetical protein